MGGGWEPIARHIISENKFLWGELPVDFNVLHVMPFLIWPQLTFHGLSLATFFPNSLHTHTHTHTHTHNDSTPGRPGRFFDSLVQVFQSFHKDVLDTLVCSGHTEMSKTWLDHIVEEIKIKQKVNMECLTGKFAGCFVHSCCCPYSQNILQLSGYIYFSLCRLWATSGPKSCLYPGVPHLAQCQWSVHFD